MYDNLQEQLVKAQQNILRRQKIDTMMMELHRQKSFLSQKVAKLKKVLDKEEADVTKLEDSGLLQLFYRILGNLEEHKQKERQEFLAARLKYEDATKELEQTEYEIEKLQKERSQYENSEQLYRELYEKKKERLLQSGLPDALRIMELTDQINRLKHKLEEIQEAIDAGSEASRHLKNATESLESAKGWGTWDMLGGGLLTDLVKHSHIDDAKVEVELGQHALLKFKTELADIKITNEIRFETDGFVKFSDFFFDNLITDWIMQDRIINSLESVNQACNKVDMTLYKLYEMKKFEKARIEELEQQIKSIIEKGNDCFYH